VEAGRSKTDGVKLLEAEGWIDRNGKGDRAFVNLECIHRRKDMGTKDAIRRKMHETANKKSCTVVSTAFAGRGDSCKRRKKRVIGMMFKARVG